MSSPRAFVVPTLSILLGALALGCTGEVFSGGNPGADGGPGVDAAPGSDSGPTPDAGPGPDGSSGLCPASVPAMGSACSVADLQCEYGTSFYPGCDTVVQCSGGVWSGGVVGTYCPGPNPSGCPSSLQAAVGQLCGSNQASCDYPDGQCTCGNLFGPPVYVDGGPTNQTWSCFQPTAGCPLPRPRLGSACTGNASCEYQSCAFSEQCVNGAWAGFPEGCAQAGGLGGP